MSDRYSRILAEYARAIDQEKLPAETVHEVKRRVLDSLGVAVAAFAEDAPKLARAYACAFSQPAGATLWGIPVQVPPETAAFANGVMVRYLDFNDTYLSKEPCHPSDVIPGLVALAEWRGRPAGDLIAAIAVAYEVVVGLCDTASLRVHGWDHVNYIAIGAVCGAGNLLGLTTEEIEHAISIATVPHSSMRQTRAGELTMWKGAAAANSVRNAVFAMLLASQGFTGPQQPFTGEMGFIQQLLQGEAFDETALRPLIERRPPRRILDTYIKAWPVEYHAQSAVDAALDLRREVGDPGRIDSVRIDTFQASYEIIAKDPEKWEPKTRETADHSLPYIVAVSLLDGSIGKESFTQEKILDPQVRSLMRDRTTLHADPELTKGYPEGIPNRITVRTTDGQVYVREARYPRGHARNSMSDDEVIAKFRRNVQGFWTARQADKVIDFVWGLERKESLAELVRQLWV